MKPACSDSAAARAATPPGAGGPPLLDLTDHIVITLIHRHLGLPRYVIAQLTGTHPATISQAISITRPLLDGHPAQSATPHRLRNLNDPITYAANASITLAPKIKPAC